MQQRDDRPGPAVSPTGKNYRLAAADMVAGLAPQTGCIATDRITVDGRPVGFMYRDEDGWNFFAGDEDQDYVDDPGNLGHYTLNTVANYDRAILPYLHAPPGSAFVRSGAGFVADPAGSPTEHDDDAGSPGLHPDFPVVVGIVPISTDWLLRLTQPMNRRIEDGSLVLWRPGLTAWITVWGNPGDDSPQTRLAQIRNGASPDRYDEQQRHADGLIHHTYRLAETAADSRVPALYGNVIGACGHLQIAVYFDDEPQAGIAAEIVAGIHLSPQPESA